MSLCPCPSATLLDSLCWHATTVTCVACGSPNRLALWTGHAHLCPDCAGADQ